MESQQLDQFRSRLNEEKAHLEKELHEISLTDRGDHVLGDHDVRFEEVGREEGENAVEVESFERNLAVKNNLEKELGAVEGALERLDSDTFGQCTRCRADIVIERLEAYPAAELCMDCAKLPRV